MTDRTKATEDEIRELKGRVAALDFMFVSLVAHLQALPGVFPGLMDSALSSAARSAEALCRARGGGTDHVAVAFRHVEALRHLVMAQADPGRRN